MSASNLPQNRVDNRERRSSYRRLLGLFQRNNHHHTAVAVDDTEAQEDLRSPTSQPEATAAQPEQTAASDQHEWEVVDTPATLNDVQARLAETEARLLARTEQVDMLTLELETTRTLLAERDVALQMQLNVGTEQRAALEVLHSTNDTLDGELHTAQAKIEQMAADHQNLQAALAASIQHAAEQQDSLVRWQELAESADECVSGLEKQVTILQQALHDCNDQREGLHQEMEETSQALAQAQTQLESLNDHQETMLHLAEARERIGELEKALQQDVEQLTAYQLSLTASQATLLVVEQQLGEQASTLEMTRGVLTAKEMTLERSRIVFGRLAASLRLKDANEKQLQERLSKLTDQMREERALWYKTFKRNEQQLAATETELENFWQGYRAQGQRMAEVQKALLARDEELAVVSAQMKQQTQLLHKLRHAADSRINHLESALSQAEQQISDLQLVVERRAKRESVSGEQ